MWRFIMSRMPAALHKRKKKKKKRSGQNSLATYLDIGSILHNTIENKLINKTKIKADKISERHRIEDLIASIKKSNTPISQSVKTAPISTTTASDWIDISNCPVNINNTFEKFKKEFINRYYKK